MFYRIIATLTLSFVFYIGSSQISYHRLYETSMNDQVLMNDTIFYHMSSTTETGDVYAMGTKRVGNQLDGFNDLSIIFTKHNDKGNIDWSKELDLGRDSVEIKSICDFDFNGTLDSILFVVDIEINGERKEIFGRLAKSGNEIDLSIVGGNQVPVNEPTLPHVAPFVNQSDLLMTPGAQSTISRIGLGNALDWSRAYEFVNEEGDTILNFLTDMKSTPDTTIVVTGLGRVFESEFVIAELDSNGVQIWAESYTFPINDLRSITPLEVTPLNNGSFAVVGTYSLIGDFDNNAFITVVDSAGSVLMSKKLIVAENSTGILNALQAADGTLWMTGIYSVNDTSTYFTVNMDLNGLINWTTIYPSQIAGFSAFSTSLLNIQATGGATFVGHGFKDDLAVMQVMKHDVDGTTPCSDTTTTIVEDLMITSDTLISQVKNGGIFFDTLAYEFNSFNGFIPPVLSINEYPPFCPNEVIDTLLIASVSRIAKENISYLWSTDEFSDTIRVMEEGQYSVTVTIVEDVCFSMCDTVELTRLMLPQIAITIDNSRFCEENILVLTGNYTPGAGNQTYLWNTGETTPSIEIMDPGVYSVTVVDDCGEMAMDDTDVSLPVFDPSVFFGTNTTDFCNTESAILTAAYTGGGNQPVFTWSDGQVGNPIIITTGGEYSVTVTDECDFNTVATNDVVFPVIATEAQITINPNCNEDDPLASTVMFEATGNGEISLSTFSVNDAGQSTLLTESNPTNTLQVANTEQFINYQVFATNICGELLDSLSINGGAICGGLLQYPIAFFPDGEDIDSKTFGPIPVDTVDVNRFTDIEFKVFNRWGETVFESTAILDAWDGTHKGDPAPSEVYIWYVSYILDGRQMLDKGDITLIR